MNFVHFMYRYLLISISKTRSTSLLVLLYLSVEPFFGWVMEKIRGHMKRIRACFFRRSTLVPLAFAKTLQSKMAKFLDNPSETSFEF